MRHLTLEQRYTIEVLRKEKYSQKKIAEILGKNKSVISREISRNCDQRNSVYKAELAHKKCLKRHKNKNKKIHFTEEIKEFVEELIEDDYSPEQIVGTAKKLGVSCVSHERIYQYLWHDKKQNGELYKHLRTQGKRYRSRGASKDKRGQIVGRVGIENRPKIVEEKTRFGDLEMDLIIGKDHKEALLTINDRATGVLKMTKISGKDALEVEQACVKELEDWKEFLHTITSDNGKEFSNHQSIANQLNIDYYFARPYHSWERGANENLNGLVRQYFPKGSSFESITEEEVKKVQDKLNNRPRKRFGFQSPNEVFHKQFLATG
jgi:transposase, IS30 family